MAPFTFPERNKNIHRIHIASFKPERETVVNISVLMALFDTCIKRNYCYIKNWSLNVQ
jgi:hypothetical protein